MIYIVVAALLVVLDQVVKFLVRTTMVLGDSMVLIPDVLGITYVQNTGAAFSSSPTQPWFWRGFHCWSPFC